MARMTRSMSRWNLAQRLWSVAFDHVQAKREAQAYRAAALADAVEASLGSDAEDRKRLRGCLRDALYWRREGIMRRARQSARGEEPAAVRP